RCDPRRGAAVSVAPRRARRRGAVTALDDTALGAPDVEATLLAVGRQVRRAMLDEIPDGEPGRWLYELARVYPSRAGKALRPALCWRDQGVVALTPEDYLELIMHKTCWYTTIHPLRVGALLGSAGRADVRRMVGFGFHLGAAFQIRDDLLNLVGDEAQYGKEIN